MLVLRVYLCRDGMYAACERFVRFESFPLFRLSLALIIHSISSVPLI